MTGILLIDKPEGMTSFVAAASSVSVIVPSLSVAV